MIGTELYQGQGLGNQLWVYATVRCAALRNGFDFALGSANRFKGKAFLNLEADYYLESSSDKPVNRIPAGFSSYYKEKSIRHFKTDADISETDLNILRPLDGTFIDGILQSEKYLDGFKSEIGKWFEVQDEYFEGCTINIRGGEYKNVQELFLAKKYYDDAIRHIRDLDTTCGFRIVTDDAKLAKSWFPEFPVISSGGVKRFFGGVYIHPASAKVGKDFASIQNSRYLIIANSSFSWWGAYTNQLAQAVIAPKYWARHNVSDGYWSQGDSLTRGWQWLDKTGQLQSFEECELELSEYRKTLTR